MRSILEGIIACGESVLVANDDRRLEEAVSEFAHELASVRDGYSDQPTGDVATLRNLTELVIERVEAKMAGDLIHRGQSHTLVEGLFDIRRALWEIEWWRRHRRQPDDAMWRREAS